MTRYGSDVAVELLERLGIRYAALNPGASLAGCTIRSLIAAARRWC